MYIHAIYMFWILSTCMYSVYARLYVCSSLLNPWLWQFGRGKPRLGGLSVEETGDRKDAAQQERIVRGAETRRGRKADCA